ncbi:MAG: type VI secretion system tip protein TssI/VgrG [Planctomycetota bacterium]
MTLVQDGRLLNVSQALEDNELFLVGFNGHEQISTPFRFELELISDNKDIDPRSVVGKQVGFSIELVEEGERRHFNGYVSRFAAGFEDAGRARTYRAEVVPWYWFLTRHSDCRIFQEKTLKEIIEEVFGDRGFSDFDIKLSGTHPKRTYTVQYRETDFAFLSRLMEEEGVWYTFKHEDGKHTMLIADSDSEYFDCAQAKVSYPTDTGSLLMADHIREWDHQWEFRSGKVAHSDYNVLNDGGDNFLSPSGPMDTTSQTAVGFSTADSYELYDYPGVYTTKSDGTDFADVAMEREETPHDIVRGQSSVRSMTPAAKFEIDRHPAKSEEGQRYVVTAVTHVGRETKGYSSGQASGEGYSNSFKCIPEATVFRPDCTTRKPSVHGVLLGIVTGPDGEEIYTDPHGRVKVHFLWDRKGEVNDKSSCWMRVSQSHAGPGFGGIDIPRIGEEVIVSFANGDPDHPVVTGRLYHADNPPPFSLPDQKTVSGYKSKTYKGEGYNEYAMDDTPGNELIREHGQFDKDSTILHDLREHVLNDRSRDVTNNETVEVGVDQSVTIGSNLTHAVGANETRSVGANRTRSVSKNEVVTVTMTRTHSVGINEMINVGAAQEVTVGGLRAVTVGLNQAHTVGRNQTTNIGKDFSESISDNHSEEVGKDRSAQVGENDTLSVGKELTVTAGDQISFTTGKASIVMKKDGTIEISGKDITINGTGQITGKASKDIVLKGKKILQN